MKFNAIIADSKTVKLTILVWKKRKEQTMLIFRMDIQVQAFRTLLSISSTFVGSQKWTDFKIDFSQKKEIFNMKQKISELEKQVMQLKEINQELMDDMPDIQ